MSGVAQRNIVVVGGGSFVGRHLVPQLASGSARIFATVRPGAAPAAIDRVEWLSTDLASATPVAGWPDTCDTVVYLAQSREWRKFPDGAADVFAVNVAGVFHAAEYARRAGARRFVLASTGSIYDASTAPLREDQPIHLTASRRFYVEAKTAAELLIRPYAASMNVVVLRLFVPYGPGQSSDMLIPQLVRRVSDDEPVVLDGVDGLRLNPIAIADVAEAFVRATTLDSSQTLNVAGPEVLSLREVAASIGRTVGRAPRFEERGGPERALIGDTTALQQTLGWAPRTTLEDGLQGWLNSKR